VQRKCFQSIIVSQLFKTLLPLIWQKLKTNAIPLITRNSVNICDSIIDLNNERQNTWTKTTATYVMYIYDKRKYSFNREVIHVYLRMHSNAKVSNMKTQSQQQKFSNKNEDGVFWENLAVK
jgi:hypothetical protein